MIKILATAQKHLGQDDAVLGSFGQGLELAASDLAVLPVRDSTNGKPKPSHCRWGRLLGKRLT